MVRRGPARSSWRTVSERRERQDVADQEMIGKVGRVTGTIAPGNLGEVMVPIRGGSEAFHAYAADLDTTISVGSRIVVVEYFPPRTVIVTPM
jgi:membrane protein implicated in regulation of membrane protease activity